mgnify:FL=1
MDKYLRFLRNINAGEGKSKRARRRLMERELKKLHNDERASDRVDGEHGR